MIYDGMEFHNIEELADREGMEGKVLCRVPQSLNSILAESTADRYRNPANAEIRFRSTAFPVSIDLTVWYSPMHIAVYLGDYQYQELLLQPGRQKIEIRAEAYLTEFFKRAAKRAFSPDIVRVIFSGEGVVSYHGVSAAGSLTPPAAEDLPKYRYLAYGTSITHGTAASSPVLAYCHQTAVGLQADVCNLGVGGSAYLEPGLGEYIAENYDFDFFTAEISVNMLNQGYTEEEYYRRAKQFLTAVDEKHPDAVKAVIGILPCFWDAGLTREAARSTADRYRSITEKLCAEFAGRYLWLDGKTLLSEENLAYDLLHPGNLGMIELGEKLSAALLREKSEKQKI